MVKKNIVKGRDRFGKPYTYTIKNVPLLTWEDWVNSRKKKGVK